MPPNKTVLVFRHIYFEDLGILEPILIERGFDIQYIDPAIDNYSNISPETPDLLIVLGSPIGAFDNKLYPFLNKELDFIEHRIRANLPVLGICLGAQLIARILGAPVAPMGKKEIGFSELTLTADGANSVLAPLAGVSVLHWHGDQFGIPADAKNLAETPICQHQAFSVGDRILALQFHLEADTKKIERWLVGHACELQQAGIDLHHLRKEAKHHGSALRMAGAQVLNAWLDRIQHL